MQKYFCNPCGYTYDPEKGDTELLPEPLSQTFRTTGAALYAA